MARPGDLIEDRTPLDGARIDVSARIGWFLRLARAGSGTSLRQMSSALGGLGHPVSVAALSTWERAGTREGLLIDRYEEVLGLAPGHLRAPVDVLCRTFAYAPSDRMPAATGPAPLADIDAVFVPLLAGTPSGGEWLRWARLLRGGGGAAAPSVLMAPLVEQLVHELVRAVGPAFVTRYEAVAQLRCSAYADLVEDVVRRLVLDPRSEALAANALSAVSEQPTPRLLAWCADLLEHRSDWVVGGACLALENMRAVDHLDPQEWDVVVEPFLRGQAAARDLARGRHYTRLFKVLAAPVRHAIHARLERPLSPIDGPRSWETAAANRHFAVADRLGAGVAERLGAGEQPMLSRLLFEVLYDFRATRVVTSAWLLMASPAVDALQPLLLALIEDPPDEMTRRGALRGLGHLQVPGGAAEVAGWLRRTAPWDDAAALGVAANAGVHVPAEVAVRALDGGEPERMVEVLGMSGHPMLAEVAGDPTRSPGVRAAASWWLDTGARVVR